MQGKKDSPKRNAGKSNLHKTMNIGKKDVKRAINIQVYKMKTSFKAHGFILNGSTSRHQQS